MPDGGEVCLDKECFTCVEPLFNADVGFAGLSNHTTRHASQTSSQASAQASAQASMQASAHTSTSSPADAMEQLITKETIPQLVVDCLSACPKRYQDELWQNIVLSGGTTLLPQFDQRLRFELNQLEPERPAPMVVADPDRELLPWLGASILADLEQVANKFVSREAHQAVSARYSPYTSPLVSKHQARSIHATPGSPHRTNNGALTPLSVLDTSAGFFRHSASSDSTVMGSPNLSRTSSARRPLRRLSVSVQDEPFNLDLADLPLNGRSSSGDTRGEFAPLPPSRCL